MISKERDNRRRDAAWDRLYNRLEQDGLLESIPGKAREKASEKSPKRAIVYSTLSWAASIVILVGATLLLTKGLFNPQEMILLQNGEESSSYATTLEDGSAVYMSQNTSISYPKRFGKVSREVKLEGEAYFEISKNEKIPFIIDTKQLIIEVLGTSFDVKASGKSAPSISVKTGEVRVTSKSNGQSLKVKAGESALLSLEGVLELTQSDSNQFSKYLTKIRFKDEKLSNVSEIINRNTPGGVQIEISPELEERVITATFYGSSADSMAQMICFALNLKFTREGERILIHQ